AFRPRPGREGGYPGVLLAAGLAAGFGVGLKLTLATFGVAAMVSLALVGRNWKQRALLPVLYGFGAFVGFAASYGHWAVRLYSRTGNPVFPFMNSLFKSPYWFASNPPIAEWCQLPGWWVKIFLPFWMANKRGIAMEVPYRDSRLEVVFVLLAVVGL